MYVPPYPRQSNGVISPHRASSASPSSSPVTVVHISPVVTTATTAVDGATLPTSQFSFSPSPPRTAETGIMNNIDDGDESTSSQPTTTDDHDSQDTSAAATITPPANPTAPRLRDLAYDELRKAFRINRNGEPRTEVAVWRTVIGRIKRERKVWVQTPAATEGKALRRGGIRRGGRKQRPSGLRQVVGVVRGPPSKKSSSSSLFDKLRKGSCRLCRFKESYVDKGACCHCFDFNNRRQWTSTSTINLTEEQERVYLRRAKEEILMPAVEATIEESLVRRVARDMEMCPGWGGDRWRKLRSDVAKGKGEGRLRKRVCEGIKTLKNGLGGR
ncbi:MAG: hypothetical protein Q9220_000618 [cf. Caloplaca sp. 1 TL-2023]